MPSQTEQAWAKLFDKLNIEASLNARGIFNVTAEQINSITNRQPRLMTKFDTRESRPDPIKKAQCTILPITNGEYVLVRGNGYANLPETSDYEFYNSGALKAFQTLPKICTTESQVIDAALASGLLQEFVGETNLVLTIRGRRRTNPFEFVFEGTFHHSFQVDGVQIEIDGGYEADKVYILEVKIGARDNFIVRQLYYPFRMWLEEGVTKEIIPIFLTYSNQTFSFTEFKFKDKENYNSIVPVRTINYSFDPIAITHTLTSLIKHIPERGEQTSIPFPQADDMRKVIDVIEAVGKGINLKDKITEYYEFARRQANYYGDAARYLGLLTDSSGKYDLTEEGKRFNSLSSGKRIERLGMAMLRQPVIRTATMKMIEDERTPSKDHLSKLIRHARPELSGTTISRRAETISKWLNWLSNNFDLK